MRTEQEQVDAMMQHATTRGTVSGMFVTSGFARFKGYGDTPELSRSAFERKARRIAKRHLARAKKNNG